MMTPRDEQIFGILSQAEIDANKEAWVKILAEINAKPPHILAGRNIHKAKNKRKNRQ